MAYLLLFLVGAIGGVICTFIILESKRRHIQQLLEAQQAEAGRQRESAAQLQGRRRELDELASRIAAERKQIESQVVAYSELQKENLILKHDLQNVDLNLRKLELDRDVQKESQRKLDERSQELAGKYLKDSIKWIGQSLTTNNFVASKQRLLNTIEWCQSIGYPISDAQEEGYLADLKAEYGKILRAAFEREEQARIKAQIREEQLREKEVERELKQLERERAAIQAALDQALAAAKDEHSAEVERLRARLAEAEEKKRAISQAQLTKSGHVYVISNIGSFGDGIFKIGMTRRLEPLERVRELGSASVPFPYDVHMMISCNDAPSLENALHRALHKLRMNKVNPRKEFFKADVEMIRGIVEKHHGSVDYVVDPEALEYRQTLQVTDDDQEFIESEYEKLEEGAVPVDED